MSSHLTELGQEAVAAVSRSVTGGTPLVKCHLLASCQSNFRSTQSKWRYVELFTRQALSLWPLGMLPSCWL